MLAKQGKYREAIPLYERVPALAPNRASNLNNLALALTMEGKAELAEELLKRAVAHGGHEARVNHNLTLVLSLRGKDEEAKLHGARQAHRPRRRRQMRPMWSAWSSSSPEPLPVVPTALKAQAGSETANPERAPGAGADAAATSRAWPRQSRVPDGRQRSIGAGGFPQRREGEQQGRQEPKPGR